MDPGDPSMVPGMAMETSSVRQEVERENRGSQSNERDLGHREETGCRGWEAWCSGRNLKTNETARGRTRVHSNETAKERTRELFERNRQGEDSSTSSRKKC